MGAFAKAKIDDTINFLNYLRLKKEIAELPKDRHLTEFAKKPIENPLLFECNELEKIIKSFDEVVHEEQIEIIDEPILKEKLSEMFDEYTGRNSRLRVIQEKIKLLRKQEQQLLEKGGSNAIS